MTNYTRGRAFEYAVRDHLRSLGYWVCRAAGSHGEADLVALRGGSLCEDRCHAFLIQCKRDGYITANEQEELENAGILTGATCVLAHKMARRGIGYKYMDRIEGWKQWNPEEWTNEAE